MGGRATATAQLESTSFWASLLRGPWPKAALERLVEALDHIAERLRAYHEVAGLVAFGSYARGEAGRSSDLDVLILFEGESPPERRDIGRSAARVIAEAEFEYRLPVHLAPLLASVDRPADLGPDLIHALWADGVVLFARAGALARLLPDGLTPWTLARYSVARAPAADRVRL